MRIKLLLVRLFILLAFVGCRQGLSKNPIPQQSEVIDMYPDGKPKSIKIFDEVNGRKEWVGEKSYYKNGTKSMEGSIINGLREGEWISWYDDGSIWSKGSFKNGLREGHGIIYYRNGNIQLEGFYQKGERTGIWKSYDEDGKLIREVNCSDSN